MKDRVRDAVLFAGGLGTRLGAIGRRSPKALVRVDGDRYLIDVVIEQLRDAGVRRVVLALGHRAQEIVDHVRDGEAHGVRAEYVMEDLPLGTAGALGLIGPMRSRFLVTNCDVVTDMPLSELVSTHRAMRADMTIAAHRVEHRSEYGVLAVDDPGAATARLVGIEEKPVRHDLVSMGVYVLEPRVLGLLRGSERIDMPELIARVLASGGGSVATHAYEGAWSDVGRPECVQRVRSSFGDHLEEEAAS